MTQPILEVRNLQKTFEVKQGPLRKAKVYAVGGVSFEIYPQDTLGIVGESGCGKSTLGRTLIRLYEPTGGNVLFKGADLVSLSSKEMRRARKNVQMIFQDPFSALNPAMTVQEILEEPYRIHGLHKTTNLTETVSELLRVVGLPEDSKSKFPHEFSGGQRQRINIARALALKPEVVIADEPVSALDVSIQAQILNLLHSLKKKFSLSMIFISHDLSVVQYISDRIAVMYLGRIVELAPAEELYNRPLHPYTQILIRAIPTIEPGKKPPKYNLRGEVASPLNPPSGCHFHPRCPMATELCAQKYPEQRNLGTVEKPHLVFCHHA
jgi:oligopeptide/dipeptide ABC transporter ATP-binding protein